MSEAPSLADDMLLGAEAISEFLFGSGDRKKRLRKTYYLLETKQIPAGKFGANEWVGSKRALRAHYESLTAGGVT